MGMDYYHYKGVGLMNLQKLLWDHLTGDSEPEDKDLRKFGNESIDDVNDPLEMVAMDYSGAPANLTVEQGMFDSYQPWVDNPGVVVYYSEVDIAKSGIDPRDDEHISAIADTLKNIVEKAGLTVDIEDYVQFVKENIEDIDIDGAWY